MDFEMARRKLEKEQRDRKEKARVRLLKERKQREDASKQREAIEAAQRARRLQASQAQLLADERLQEQAFSGRGIVFSRVLEASSFAGIGDKIKLPPSCFTELSDKGAFEKGPLYFHISVVPQETPSTEVNQTYCGVLEFTAEEGSVALSAHLWKNLFPLNTFLPFPLVEVRYVWLPKGTYAKLQPDNLGFSDIPFHKALLERNLRHHTTMSQGDIITIEHGLLSFNLRVLELKPASSVSILETDIEVDIVSPPSSSQSPNYLLKPLVVGSIVTDSIEEGNFNYYKFVIEESTFAMIASSTARVEIKITPQDSEGDTDLYLSKHPLLFPSKHNHEWSSYEVGSKNLTLSSKDSKFTSGSYSIGVYGFKGAVNYSISVNIVENEVGIRKVSGGSLLEEETKMCSNCKRQIPSRSIALHEAYCSRHNFACGYNGCGIVLRTEEAKSHTHCDKCGVGMQVGEVEKHKLVFHEPMKCACGVVLEKEKMDEHRATMCPQRLIACRFCGDMVEAEGFSLDLRDKLKGLTEHESKCGSRTAPCDLCGRSVMLKEMDIHHVAVHPKC